MPTAPETKEKADDQFAPKLSKEAESESVAKKYYALPEYVEEDFLENILDGGTRLNYFTFRDHCKQIKNDIYKETVNMNLHQIKKLYDDIEIDDFIKHWNDEIDYLLSLTTFKPTEDIIRFKHIPLWILRYVNKLFKYKVIKMLQEKFYGPFNSKYPEPPQNQWYDEKEFDDDSFGSGHFTNRRNVPTSTLKEYREKRDKMYQNAYEQIDKLLETESKAILEKIKTYVFSVNDGLDPLGKGKEQTKKESAQSNQTKPVDGGKRRSTKKSRKTKRSRKYRKKTKRSRNAKTKK